MDYTELSDVDVMSMASSSLGTFRSSGGGYDGSDGGDGGDAAVMALKDRIETLEAAIATLEASGKERDAKLESIERKVDTNNGAGEGKVDIKMASHIAFAPAATPKTTSARTSNMFPKTKGFTPSATTDLVDSLDFSTKGQIWGTAFASMLIGIARQYKIEMSRRDLLIDEVAIINRCIMLIDKTSYFGDHVPTKDDWKSSHIARLIKGTDHLHFATAENFRNELRGTTTNTPGVFDHMISKARELPECLGWPFSRLIPESEILHPNKSKIFVHFAIPASLPAEKLAVWGAWCLSLEPTDLAYYISLMQDGFTRRKAAKKVTLRFPEPAHDA